MQVTTKANSQFLIGGANIDANFGPWGSIDEYLDFLHNEIGTEKPAVGTLIAVKQEDGSVQLMTFGSNDEWGGVGGNGDIPLDAFAPEWDEVAEYIKGSIVKVDDSIFVAKQDVEPNNKPPQTGSNSNWERVSLSDVVIGDVSLKGSAVGNTSGVELAISVDVTSGSGKFLGNSIIVTLPVANGTDKCGLITPAQVNAINKAVATLNAEPVEQGVSITAKNTNNEVLGTFGIGLATETSHGVMSSADKQKLENLAGRFGELDDAIADVQTTTENAIEEIRTITEDVQQSEQLAKSHADTATNTLNEIQHVLEDAADKGESEAIAGLAGKVELQKTELGELSREVDEIVGVDVKAYSYSVAGEGVEIRKTLTVGTTWSDTALTTRNAHNVLRADISDASGEIEITYCRTYVEGVPAIAIVSNDNVVLGLLYPSEIKKNFTISFNVNDYKGAKYVYSGYYSTLIPSVVQKAVVGQVDKKIAPIKADVSKLALLRLGNWFYGKKVAIIGDSISTFNAEGYKYADYATYYPSATHAQDVKEVTDTWWKKVLDSVDASLAVNLAYSGSMVSNYRTITYGTYPSLCDRIPLIGDVDTLIIALGTNDSRNAKNVPLGEYDYDAEIIDETKFRTAYIGGIKKAYELNSNVKIICVILDMLTAYADSIKEIAKHYGLPCIDCRGYTMSDDAPHPNKQGMEDIAHLFLSATPYASAGGSSSENSEDVVINQKKGKNLINAYIKQDGSVTTSLSWDSYKINNIGYKKLNFKVNNLLSYASYPYIAVGFYSSEDPSAKSLMDESITFENYASGTELSVDIPDGCKTIVVCNRTQNGDALVSVVADLSILFESIGDSSSKDVKFEHNGLKTLWNKDSLWSQGACCVDGKICGFTASVDTTLGQIRVIDKGSFTQERLVRHLFGHCNTCDYHEEVDTLLTTHYFDENNPSEIQGLYLVKQFKSLLQNDSIGDVGLLISGLSFVTGSLMGACYGESSDIVYLCSFVRPYSTNGTRYFYKVVMGKGDNNLSSANNGYGTFISGCADNEYNGTLKLIGVWEGYWVGEIQGMKYLNGHIIVSTDINVGGVLTAYISKVKLDGENAVLVANHWIPALINGDYTRCECEEFAIDESFGWVATASCGTFKFPLACL